MTAPQHYKWFFETTTPVEGHMHAIARTLASRQTKYQFMEILETHSYGKCLVLAGFGRGDLGSRAMGFNAEAQRTQRTW